MKYDLVHTEYMSANQSIDFIVKNGTMFFVYNNMGLKYSVYESLVLFLEHPLKNPIIEFYDESDLDRWLEK
jgi:hypothetical protein